MTTTLTLSCGELALEGEEKMSYKMKIPHYSLPLAADIIDLL